MRRSTLGLLIFGVLPPAAFAAPGPRAVTTPTMLGTYKVGAFIPAAGKAPQIKGLGSANTITSVHVWKLNGKPVAGNVIHVQITFPDRKSGKAPHFQYVVTVPAQPKIHKP